MWPFGCSAERHRDIRVVALGAELRGDPQSNDVRPYVRFYLECKRCGRTANRLREVGKTYVTPTDLVDAVVWDDEP